MNRHVHVNMSTESGGERRPAARLTEEHVSLKAHDNSETVQHEWHTVCNSYVLQVPDGVPYIIRKEKIRRSRCHSETDNRLCEAKVVQCVVHSLRQPKCWALQQHTQWWVMDPGCSTQPVVYQWKEGNETSQEPCSKVMSTE
jgi:hypothetical protein